MPHKTQASAHRAQNHKTAKELHDDEAALQSNDGVPDIELDRRDSGCVGRHTPNCGCTGNLRGPIEDAETA